MARLRAQAAREGVSISALVRRGVDLLIESEASVSRAKRVRRALEAVGRYSSGKRDVAARHDDYLDLNG